MDKEVDRCVVERLLDAAVQAPSAMNSQSWAFGVIQGKDKLREFSTPARMMMLKKIDESPEMEKYRELLSDPNFNIFYDAPVLVIIYAKPTVGLLSVINCSLAAQNLMLAAKDGGLATCWIGFCADYFHQDEVKRELGVPLEFGVVAAIVVGYQSEEPPAREKNAPEILFWK
jgi:nitroreductase